MALTLPDHWMWDHWIVDDGEREVLGTDS